MSSSETEAGKQPPRGGGALLRQEAKLMDAECYGHPRKCCTTPASPLASTWFVLCGTSVRHGRQEIVPGSAKSLNVAFGQAGHWHSLARPWEASCSSLFFPLATSKTLRNAEKREG